MFGDVSIKQEGMYSSFDHPEVLPWFGCVKEFQNYFNNKYKQWYLKPFKCILQKIAVDAWNNALFENAKLVNKINKEKNAFSKTKFRNSNNK